ncbi:uncharacterized protein Tco025E_02435 [Trypanosoma conorhini]|uniref:Uncharacterized protein n=1 Tax=Trypanosoma conorhini TaxID=83891 RepID=A0A422Q3Z8_9TRYP|nr:uncharacterized protein Tco025E_02435 [Trypanosoma conorhini]RNF24676.1 hypothetical protein Tco025E_02435 [Trypanosoma conorhini]
MTFSSSPLQRRVDAALQHRLLLIERKQQTAGDGLDEVTPPQFPGSLLRRYELPAASINRNTESETTQEITDGEDEIQHLIRDAFSLAASHSSHDGRVVTASDAAVSGVLPGLLVTENAYLRAMRTAYRLYGQEANDPLADVVASPVHFLTPGGCRLDTDESFASVKSSPP